MQDYYLNRQEGKCVDCSDGDGAAWFWAILGLLLIVIVVAMARVKREHRVRFARWRMEHREELGQLVRGARVHVSTN